MGVSAPKFSPPAARFWELRLGEGAGQPRIGYPSRHHHPRQFGQWSGYPEPTSPRERHVYNRAAKFYYAAFELDPGKSGRTLAAWLRRAPMETDEPAPAAAS